MFGGLMAHLGQARERLAKDKSLLEHQSSVEASVKDKHREERRKIRMKEIEAAREDRDKELLRRDQITGRQKKAVLALRSNAWIQNQELLIGFIFTKVSEARIEQDSAVRVQR
ncbi:unnamed protein product [Discosporangium mesarthrocarpum]